MPGLEARTTFSVNSHGAFDCGVRLLLMSAAALTHMQLCGAVYGRPCAVSEATIEFIERQRALGRLHASTDPQVQMVWCLARR